MSDSSSEHILARLDRGLAKLEDGLSFAAAIVILLLMVFGTVNVIGRKFFSMPVWGYNDIVTLSMVAFSFLAISAMQRVGGHIRMELFVRRMSGRLLWTAEWLGVVVAILIMVVLIIYSYNGFFRSFDLGDSTIDRELSTWPSKIWVPIAFAVLIARLLLQSAGYMRLIIDPKAEPLAVPVMHDVKEIADKEIHDALGDLDDASKVD